MATDPQCRFVTDDGSRCTAPPAQAEADFCSAHLARVDNDLEIFKVLHAHLLHDIQAFWTRSNFYLAIETALLALYVGGIGASGDVSGHPALAAVGLVLTVFWWLVAHGSILWIRRWRSELMQADLRVDRHRTFERTERFAGDSPLWSASNVTQFLPFLYCTVWVLLVAANALR